MQQPLTVNQSIPFGQQPTEALTSMITNQIQHYPPHIQPTVMSTQPPQIVQPTPTPKTDDPKKRNFKHHCSKIVVNRLSAYFNNGQIGSKEDFKQLSRKIVSSLIEKEQPRGYPIDKDTDQKIKKFVDTYYSQYQGLVNTMNKEKSRAKVEDWLQAYSPTATSL